MKQIKDRVAEIQVSYRPAISKKPLIVSALDAFVELIEFFPRERLALQEKFVVMYLNRCGRVLGVYEMSQGGITGTVVDIRLLFSVALKVAATGVILCHNHPSGNLTPSKNDIEITKKVKEVADLLDIKVLDHIIINSDCKYLSMGEQALI